MAKDECMKLPQTKTINEIELLVSQYNKGEKIFKNLQDEISFLYNIGSFYAEYYQIKDPIRTIFRDEDKYYIGIYYYLNAIRLYEDNKDTVDNDIDFLFETVRRLYVNIGNDFSNQFRSISALSYFRKALEIDNVFDMAIGNFALGIEHHSPLVGLSEDKYCMVFNLLYELYYRVNIDNLDSGQEIFLSKKLHYRRKQEEYIRTILQGKDANYDPYACFTEITGNDYEDWCIKNTLYLNFINDLGNYEEAKFDIDVHTLQEELKLTEAQLYILDYLFKLCSFQRRKIFQCKELNNNENFFELAQVFQNLYSYFDKIAFFIYKFYGLMGKEFKVDINTIWNMKDTDGNNLLKYKNQFLYNIYWLRKEYREKTNDKQDHMNINELLFPDAQDYADIRNTIEHKQFSFRQIDELLYLNPNLLYNKTIKLASVIRNMILSVVQLVRTERKLIDPKTNKRNFDLVYLEFEGFK